MKTKFTNILVLAIGILISGMCINANAAHLEFTDFRDELSTDLWLYWDEGDPDILTLQDYWFHIGYDSDELTFDLSGFTHHYCGNLGDNWPAPTYPTLGDDGMGHGNIEDIAAFPLFPDDSTCHIGSANPGIKLITLDFGPRAVIADNDYDVWVYYTAWDGFTFPEIDPIDPQPIGPLNGSPKKSETLGGIPIAFGDVEGPSAVPIPGTLLLLGSGLVGLVGLWRRKLHPIK